MRRLAIVTGASRGIGRETALLLAEAGCSLVLAARSEGALHEVAAACAARGNEASPVVADLRRAEECRRLVAKARSVGDGAYPVLVNNAGSASFGDTASMEPERLMETLESNFLSAVWTTQAALPWMLQVGGGQVINVLSVAAVQAFPGSAAYCSAKAGLLMFGRSLALEYRSRGIRVNALMPGSTDTPFWSDKDWKPEAGDMLPARAVAEAVRDLVLMPADRNVDEMLLMPPKGIL